MAAGHAHSRQRDPVLQIGQTLAHLYSADELNANRFGSLLDELDNAEQKDKPRRGN